MILADNTMSVCSDIFECCKVKFEPLARGNLYHLMFITALIIVWSHRP